MPNVSTLTVRLSANSAKLVREFNKAQRRAQTFGQKVKSSIGVAASAFARLGVVAAGAVGVMAVAAIKTADQIGKLTDRLGGSTEAFSELKFVAERSGVAFNSLTMGLQRMQRRVAEAAQNSGEAKDALKELGISAQAISKLSIDKQFEVIADALLKVEESGDKTRLAMKLFDSEGVALLQTMQRGAVGIRELREQARKLGVSLSQEQVDAATKANEAIINFNASINALKLNLTLGLLPAINESAEAMSRLFSSSLDARIDRQGMKIRMLEDLGLDPRFSRTLKNAYQELEDLVRERTERIANAASTTSTAAFGTELEALSEVIVTTAKKTDVYGQGLAAFSKQFQTAEMRVTSLQRRLAFFAKDLSAEQIKMVNDYIQEIRTSGLEEIDLSTLPMKKIAEASKPVVKEMSEQAKQAARNMQDAFAEFLFDPFEDGLKGMLRSFVDVIRRMLANQAALELFGFLGGLKGGIGKFFSLAGRASGGPVSAGKPYLVGERGPELMVPGASGTIVPNHQLAGGVTFNFQTNIESRGAMDAETLVPILEENNRKVKGEFLEELNRGKYK